MRVMMKLISTQNGNRQGRTLPIPLTHAGAAGYAAVMERHTSASQTRSFESSNLSRSTIWAGST